MYTEILLYNTDEYQPLDALKSIITLKFYLIPLGHVHMKKSCPEKVVHPPAESTEKIVDPFARAKSTRTCSDCHALSELTQLANQSVCVEKRRPVRKVTLPSKKGEPAARSVTLLPTTNIFLSHLHGSPRFLSL